MKFLHLASWTCLSVLTSKATVAEGPTLRPAL